MKRSNILFVFALSILCCTACIEDPDADTPTLWETLTNDPTFSTFVSAAEKADLDVVLQGNNTMTLFVPDNTAFDDFLQKNGISSLDDIDKATLTNLLYYHIQFSRASIGDIVEGYYFTPSQGGADDANLTIYFSTAGGQVVINNSARIERGDIEARNGFIHRLDEVIDLPRIETLLAANKDSGESFLNTLQDFGLGSLITSGENKTIFAPTANAFLLYLNERDVSNLGDLPEEEVRNILRYHIAPGNHLSWEYTMEFENIETYLSGEDLEIGFSGGFLLINSPDAAATFADIQGINGALHFVTAVLIP